MPDEFVPPKTAKPKGITPDVQIKEPPKEILEKTFTLDPSISFNNDTQRITTEQKDGKEIPVKQEGQQKAEEAQQSSDKEPVQKKEEVKVEVEKKVEDKKVEDKKPELPSYIKAPKAKEEKKEEGGKAGVFGDKTFTPKKVERDYTGFSTEETTHLKQMSNEAFDFASKVIRQNKELSASKDGAFYQHPDAYVLTPEYNQLQQDIYYGQKERGIWMELLERVQKGEKVKMLSGWDNKGSPIYHDKEWEPSARVEEELRTALSQCTNGLAQKQSEVGQIPIKFKGKVQNDLQAINQEMQNRFMWVKDPSLLDFTLTLQTGDGKVEDKSIKDIKQDLVNLFPPYMRKENPALELASNMLVAMLMQGLELEEAKKGKQVADTKREEVARGEPTSQNKPQKQPDEINGVRTFSMEGMPSR